VVGAMAESGFGLECVSVQEVRLALRVLGHASSASGSKRVLFTPNFVASSELRAAAALGAEVVVDSVATVEGLGRVPGARIGVRIDPASLPGWEFDHGQRRGGAANAKVTTAGREQKFGCAAKDLPAIAEAIERAGAHLVGLHAHAGSGATDPAFWESVGRQLASAATFLSDAQKSALEWVDLGGGIAVTYRPGDAPVVLDSLALAVRAAKDALRAAGLAHVALRMEPGRFCVAPAGVLLTLVTAVKHKEGNTFVGVSAGMNALLRPALYDAHHAVIALPPALPPSLPPSSPAPPASSAPPTVACTVVGPICESADVVSRRAALPADVAPGRILLVCNAGAYGHVMSSNYNARGFLPHIILDN
jgi:bifunctional diaminopimelate decarboxylase / aspartate kinase